MSECKSVALASRGLGIIRRARAVSLGFVFAVLIGSTSASASTLLVDRGLPTANLNNAAGSDRSNVSWVGTGYSQSDYWVTGDTFTNTSSNTWKISSIRLWTTDDEISSLSLWGGAQSSNITVISSSYTLTKGITYSNGETYQGASGTYYSIDEIDFAVGRLQVHAEKLHVRICAGGAQ